MSQALAVDSDPNSFALEEVIVGTNSIRIEFHHIAILSAAILAAVACVPSNPNGKLHFSDLLRFPGRPERLQRTRWQWFSMVALLLVVRLQAGLPLPLEIIVAVEFVIFLALPTRAETTGGEKSRSVNAAAVGSR